MTQRWAKLLGLASSVLVSVAVGGAGPARAAAPDNAPDEAPDNAPVPAAHETPVSPLAPTPGDVMAPAVVAAPSSALLAPPVSLTDVRAAEPEAEPRAGGGVGAPLAGALTAVVPFVAGCALWSSGTRPNLEKAGTYVMVTGFAAAPWVSHGLQRRWRRAAVFGTLATATAAATIVAMDVKDPFNPLYVNRQRVPFGMLLTSAMFASIIGVFDSFLVSERP
jgi:hypothetical protein